MISYNVLSNYHSIKVCLSRGVLHPIEQALKPQKAFLAMDPEIKTFTKSQSPDYLPLTRGKEKIRTFRRIRQFYAIMTNCVISPFD